MGRAIVGVVLQGCPDEEQISAFVGGGLDPGAHEQVESHLDGCDACSRLVADLVRIYADEPSAGSVLSSGSLTRTEGSVVEERNEPELLSPGSVIGRYRTLECVGIGGMGVVYAAYDPQLDRRIALKLLLDDASAGAERKRSRLLREAQSMAKLTHPNVITVHDVGTWHGQVFVAMEFVEGGTLKSWMREQRRSWDALRDTVLAAGRGLAAAHLAGLVHRDFKPDNVLIGSDGRVRVTDFGLARWEDGVVSTGHQILSNSGEASLSFDDEEVLSAEVSLTRTGALVGTPAYMAPELYAHEIADAATDQFAYCVAVYEALYGERPFRGQTLAELATNVVSSDAIEFPSAVTVPRHVRVALRRGLSRRRADRYPSMGSLLAALERRGARRWRQLAVVGVPAALLGVGMWSSTQSGTNADGCDAEGRPIAEVWNPERRVRIARAFTVSGSPLAAGASDGLLADVDAFVDAWTTTARSTCEARSRGGQDAFVALSERCLAERRLALDVALESFDEVDAQDISRATGLVESLRRDCGDEVALLSEAPPPVPAALREKVAEIRLDLARMEGHQAAGEYAAGLALARALDTKATELGHRPLQAETRRALAELLDFSGEVEEASAKFEEAELLATASRFHRITASALAQSVYVRGVLMQQHDEARRLARRAEAAGEAANLGDPFRSALQLNRASVEYSAGDYEAAERFAEEALRLRDREATPRRWADAAYNLASIRMSMGHNAEAVGTLRAYIDTFEGEVGHLHPEVAVGYHTLSMALLEVGDAVEGEKALRTSLEIVEKTVGKEHPLYASPLSDLASLEAEHGKYAQAIAMTREAAAIREAHGVQPLFVAVGGLHVAQWLSELGELDKAREELEQAHERAVAAVGEEHPRLSEFFLIRATIEARSGDRKAAEAAMERSAALSSPVLGDGTEARWSHQLSWAGMLRVLGEPDEAQVVLRTLLADTEGKRSAFMLAQARFELAQILGDKDPASGEAKALAESALRGFRDAGRTSHASDAAAWLTTH